MAYDDVPLPCSAASAATKAAARGVDGLPILVLLVLLLLLLLLVINVVVVNIIPDMEQQQGQEEHMGATADEGERGRGTTMAGLACIGLSLQSRPRENKTREGEICICFVNNNYWQPV